MLGNSAVAILYDGYGHKLDISNDGGIYRLVTKVIGSGVAGSPSSGVSTIQGIAGGTAVNISGTVISNAGTGNFTVVQSTASSLNATVTQGLAANNSGAWTVKITDGTNILGTSSNPIRIDPTGSTAQPISGTITANVGLTNGLALDATLSKLTIAQGASLGSNTQVLLGGSVSTSTPSYVNGQISPLSLDTTGALRIAGSISATNPSVATTASSPPASATFIGGSVTTAAPSYSSGQMNALSLTTGGLLRIDGSGSIQPVFGTGNFNIVGIATDNSTNSNAKLPVLSARANSSAPTWVDGYQVPLSVDTSGALRITGSISAVNNSVGSNNTSLPTSSTLIGGSDGTNLQSARIFDLDSGGGTQYVIGVGLRKSASGGSVELGTSSDPIRVDPTGSTTQPISGTITANAGSGTFTVSGSVNASQSGTWTVQPGNTANTTPWLSTINQGGNSATVTASNALKVDGSGVTQPISGTITANIGSSNGLALDSTITKLTISQSAALGSNTQILIGGSVTTSSPTYTTGNINPFSLTTSGALRIDGSSTTQPVSGTITANAGTGTFTVGGTVNSSQSGTWTIQPGNTANTTPWLTTISQGGNSATVTVSNALKVDGSAVTQPVSGTITANAGTGSFTVAQSTASNLNATIVGTTAAGSGASSGLVTVQGNASGTPIPISGTVTASNPSVSSTGSSPPASATYVGGSVTTSAPTYTNGQISALSLTTGGLLRIDGSGATQPISGTITANAGTGSFTVAQATAANLNATVTGTVSVTQSTASNLKAQTASESTTATSVGTVAGLVGGSVTTSAPTYTTGQMNAISLTTSGAIRTDGSGATQPISGTVTANAGTGTFAVSGTVTSNIGTTNGLALDTNLVKLTIAQGTSLGSNTQVLMGGSVTTSAPTYTTGQISPLSLDTTGALRITGSISASNPSVSSTGSAPPSSATYIGGSVTTSAPSYINGQMSGLSLTTSGLLRVDGSGSTQPISGTVTSNQGGAWTVSATQSGTWTIQPGNTANTTPWLTTISQGGNSAVVTASNALKIDGSAVTQPVSGTITSNIGTTNGLALDATLTGGTQQSKITDGTNVASVKAASTAAIATDKALVVAISPNNTVAASQSGTWTVQPGNTANTTPWLTTINQGGNSANVTASNALKVDGSAVTQPVSGTITANAGTGSFTVAQSVAANLKTQTASEATVATSIGTVANLAGGSVTTAAPTYTTGQMNALSLTTAGALRTDNSAVTQPISGTITANIGTSGSLALDATTSKLTIAQGASLGSNTQVLMGASVTTSAPTYTNGQISPLSLDTTGALRITGSISATNPSVSATNAAPPSSATYIGGSVTTAAPSYTNGQMSPLSLDTTGALRITGSISASNPSVSSNNAAIASSSTQIGGSDGTNLQTVRVFDLDSGVGTQYILGVGLRKAASGGSVELGTSSDPIRIDPTGTTTQPVSGTITANAGTGNFTVVQATAANLNATVSGTVAATQSGTWNITNISGTISLPTGAATEASLAKLALAQGSTTSGQSGTLILGAVTTAAPSYTTAQSNSLSLTTSGSLRVDGSGSTQPISGTVTANAGTGTFGVSGTVTSNQGGSWTVASTQSGTWTVQPGNTANTTPWLTTINQGGNSATVTASNALKVDGSAVTQPVSGTITANIGTTNGLALDATLTGGTQQAKITDGTNVATVKAASTAAIATDKALVVAVSPNNTVAVTQSGTWTVQPGNTANTTPWLATINQGGNSATVTASNALKVDGSAVTQPVSGTITANIGTSGSLALDATVAKLTISQGTSLGSNTQVLMGGSVTTGAPTYTTGQISPLSLDTTGALRITGSISASNPSVSTTGSSPPASATYIGGSVTTAAPSYTTGQMSALSLTTGGLLRIDGSGVTQPVSGTITANIGTSGSLALDATVAKLTIAQGTALGSNTQALIGGSVTTAAPTYTTGNINPLSLTTAGALRIDGSGATQPVSGTVTANAGTGSFTVAQSTAANLRSQTASEATTATSTGTVANLAGGAVTTAAPTYTTGQMNPLSLTTSGSLRVDGSGSTQPVSGTVSATQSGTWTVQPGNTANTTPWLTTINQGGNSAAVKAASTVAATTDAALVVTQSPNNPLSALSSSKAFNATTTQTGGAVWTPGAGKKIAVSSVVIGSYGTTAARLILWFGSSVDTTYTAGTDQAVLAASFAPSTTAKPGLVFTPASPVFCSNADYVLRCTTDAGMSVDIVVHGYEF